VSTIARGAAESRYLLGVGAAALLAFLGYLIWRHVALAYVSGAVIMLLVEVIGLRATSKEPSIYRRNLFTLQEVSVHKHGRFVGALGVAVSLAISATTWPVVLLAVAYLLFRGGVRHFGRATLFGAGLLPVWVSSASFTALALAAVLPGAGPAGPDSVRWAACLLIAGTILILLHGCLFSNMKEDALGHGGNPILNYSLSMAIHLVCAALARLALMKTTAASGDGLLNSIYSILSFRDLGSMAQAYGLTPGDLANDPAGIAKALGVPAGLWLRGALSVLFYIGFLRFGLEILGLKREDRHYFPLACAHAAIGDYPRALGLAKEARQMSAAKLLAAAIKVQLGDYDQVTKLTRRACELSGIPVSVEEEVALALLFAGDVVLIETGRITAYLAFRLPALGNAHTATLIGLFALPPPPAGANALVELRGSSPIGDDPFFKALEADTDEEFDEALASLGQGDMSPRLLRLLARAMAVTLAGQRPDAAAASQSLKSEWEFLEETDIEGLPHWRLLLAGTALHKARMVHHGFYPQAEPIATELQLRIWEAIAQSDLMGEYASVMRRIQEREFHAAPRTFAGLHSATA
jgi:hypothetical protein